MTDKYERKKVHIVYYFVCALRVTMSSRHCNQASVIGNYTCRNGRSFHLISGHLKLRFRQCNCRRLTRELGQTLIDVDLMLEIDVLVVL